MRYRIALAHLPHDLMITAEQNQRMTRIGSDQPAGRLLRQYWQPVALADELRGSRPVCAVRVLGEDFVVFRDQDGVPGLIDRHCAHRGADLLYGRLEDGGLRCPFHGWLFDVNGKCLAMPAEPADSRAPAHVRQRAFPVVERSGIIWGYFGEPPAPAFADFDCFVAPDEYTFAFKGWISCNWLQALEVGIDPAHASFLHRFFEDEALDGAYGKQFRSASADSDLPMTRVMREYDRPRIDYEAVDWGLRLLTRRRVDDEREHVRVTNLCFPQAFVIPLAADMTITQWHVPIDDANNYWYAIFTSFGKPVDKTLMRNQRLELYELPDYKPRLNAVNRYGFDPYQQRTQTYTGMGADINVHDQWAVESQGPIHDRTREHLVTSDRVIAAYRRMLLAALDAQAAGRPLPARPDAAADAARLTGPITIDGIAHPDHWQQYWRDADARKRAGALWARHAA